MGSLCVRRLKLYSKEIKKSQFCCLQTTTGCDFNKVKSHPALQNNNENRLRGVARVEATPSLKHPDTGEAKMAFY